MACARKGEDWVRDELLGAIKAGNPVLPVLVGNADELKVRLGELPEAFHQQAVTVSSDLAGFDLHKVEKALRNLERSVSAVPEVLVGSYPIFCQIDAMS